MLFRNVFVQLRLGLHHTHLKSLKVFKKYCILKTFSSIKSGEERGAEMLTQTPQRIQSDATRSSDYSPRRSSLSGVTVQIPQAPPAISTPPLTIQIFKIFVIKFI